jgi:glycosyltransferase involved in cell wall biosynthesis
MVAAASPEPQLSIVAPVYNERENLEPLVSEIRHTLEPGGMSFEILLVNDGSTDGSAEKIGQLARDTECVRGLHFRENRGQTSALDAGFKAARGERVVTIDSDLQNDPADIPRLLAALSEAHAAVGYRVRREDGWLRRISSTIANGVRNRLTGDDIIDTGCTLKAYRRDALAELKLLNGMHRFLPTLLRMEGFRVVQIPVGHRPRRHGRTKYGVWNRVFRTFADLLAVRWMQRRQLDYEVIRHDP